MDVADADADESSSPTSDPTTTTTTTTTGAYWRARVEALESDLRASHGSLLSERAARLDAVAAAESRVLAAELRVGEVERELGEARAEMAGLRQALEAVARRNMVLERDRHELQETLAGERTDTAALLERLAAQRVADEVVKAQLDEENARLKRKVAELTAFVERVT